MAFRPKLWPTLFTVPALIALIALGSWQIHRLYWKDTLIERLQERAQADPVALPVWIDDLEAFEFRRVAVTGEFLHDKEYYVVNRSLNGKHGLNIVTLFKRADGGGYVLVNRGWVPFEKREPKTRPEGQITGGVTIEGIVRLAKGPNLFTPDNEPHNNTWFYIDPSSMTASAGLPPVQRYYILAANASPGGFPVGHQWRIDIKNDHLQYAITWFALAIGLLVIYIVYHRQLDRRPEDE
jgi:surfeit locus 1 family protein